MGEVLLVHEASDRRRLPLVQGIHSDSVLHYDSSRRVKTAGRHRMLGIRHPLIMPAEMRESGQSCIKRVERELQAANADEVETLLTMLKLRDDWEGLEMAWRTPRHGSGGDHC
jgi:hypothetical protein